MQTQISSPLITVTINHLGAEVCSIKNSSGIEFIWQAGQEWQRHAPVLFPVVGRLNNNSYTFKSKEYQLGQHGFARDREFTLRESNERYCTFELVADESSKENYPFDFVFQIHYRVEEGTLFTEYKVINPSGEELFFSVGAHPAFNCPMLANEAFEDYYLEFEGDDYDVTSLAEGLRTSQKKKLHLNNKHLFLSTALFANDALVFESGQINAVSLCSSRSGHKITLSCIGWPYFGIWTKPNCNKFICLEPWYGIAGRAGAGPELENKEGIIKLGAKAEFSCSFSISVG